MDVNESSGSTNKSLDAAPSLSADLSSGAPIDWNRMSFETDSSWTLESETVNKLLRRCFGIDPSADLSHKFGPFLTHKLNEFAIFNLSQIVLQSVYEQFRDAAHQEVALKLSNRLSEARHDGTLPVGSSSPEFSFVEPIAQYQQGTVLFMRYLLNSYHVIDTEKAKKIHADRKMQTLLDSFSFQCVTYSILLLSQKIPIGRPLRSSSPLFPFILHRSMPDGFLKRLITMAQFDSVNYIEIIFHPLLTELFFTMEQTGSISLEDQFKLPLQALLDLCTFKIGDIRPICQVVSIAQIKRIQAYFY